MRKSGPAIVLAHDAAEIVEALARRRRHLGYAQLDLDERAGFQLGYTGKLECPDGMTRKGKRWGRRCIHPMFDLWIQSLGVGVAIVPLRHLPKARPRPPGQMELALPAPGGNMEGSARHGGTVGPCTTHVKPECRGKRDTKKRQRKKRAA